MAGSELRDVVLVSYNGIEVFAVVADVGPPGKYGEGSILLHRLLGFERDRLAAETNPRYRDYERRYDCGANWAREDLETGIHESRRRRSRSGQFREVISMSEEENSTLEKLVEEVDKIIPLKKWIAALIVGAFSVGAWATTLQIKSNEHEDKIITQKREIDDLKSNTIEMKNDIKWLVQFFGKPK
jgi:hypothetical protein